MAVLTISEDHSIPLPVHRSLLKASSVPLQTSNSNKFLSNLQIAYV
jgi:hypothetical protein